MKRRPTYRNFPTIAEEAAMFHPMTMITLVALSNSVS